MRHRYAPTHFTMPELYKIDFLSDFIIKTQIHNGEIPWNQGGKTDPWDHVEAAMGISVCGHLEQAQKAYLWLSTHQLPDGSWYSEYRNGSPTDKTRDTNLSSYIAVGLLHFYLITHDLKFLFQMWQTIRSAIDFSLSLQTEDGQIYWAKSPTGIIDKKALLTGNSSILNSLRAALIIGKILGIKMPRWEDAFRKLKIAISNSPNLYDMSKSRFAMDWYYPILCGAISGQNAQKRIDKYWDAFVMEGHGVRCVVDRPWVTIAESAELILTLISMGKINLSKKLFSWIVDKQYEDGAFWCGYTLPDMAIWPEEKTTWTNAVVILAADALFQITPASELFSFKENWS